MQFPSVTLASACGETSTRSIWNRRTLVTRTVVPIVLLIVTVTILLAASGPAAGLHDEVSASHSVTVADGNASVDSADVDGVSEPVELIVQLEGAEIPADLDETAVESTLEEHAEDTQEPLLVEVANRDGVEVQTTFWLANAVLIEVDPDEYDPDRLTKIEYVEGITKNVAIEPLGRSDVVETAQTGVTVPGPVLADAKAYDYTHHALADDTRPHRTRASWGVETVRAPAVWDEYETRGAGVRVAVLDTGIDIDHPDLDLYSSEPGNPTYPGGWAEFDRDGQRVAGSTPYDSANHGTHVGGILAGGDASGEYVGVAPEAELMAGQVISGEEGSLAQLLAGMEWAVEEDADVLSMSLGVDGRIDPLVDPIRHAEASGVTVVAAIGNEGPGTSGSPGNVYDTLSVGAIDTEHAVASFSGGEHVLRAEWENPPADWPDEYVVPTVVAPGVSITSTLPDGEYGRFSGTSMATPHVSGSIALLLSIDDDLDPDEVRTVIQSTAWTPDGQHETTEERYGAGIVDAKAAANFHGKATLEGRVMTEDGTGIEGASITVDDTTVTTDETGEYRLRVRSGTRSVTVDATGYRANVTTLDLSPGTTVRHDVTLVSDPVMELYTSHDPAESSTEPVDWLSTGLRLSLVALVGIALAAAGWIVHGRRTRNP